MSDDTEYPTDKMHEIAARHAKQGLAAIGRETIRGATGWKFQDPEGVLREMILGALMDAEAQRRDAEAKPHGN